MITPTIGRIVWFTPSAKTDFRVDVQQPNAAIVVYVWHNRLVNLTVFDHTGNLSLAPQVRLLQDDDAKPEEGYFASWMPYQKGQAAKAELLESQSIQNNPGYGVPSR